MKRIVYRKIQEYITEKNSSIRYEYTNQIFKNGEWEFYNRFIGKFGARPIIWYYTLEAAEQCAPNDDEVNESIEWDGMDKEGYKNVYKPYNN